MSLPFQNKVYFYDVQLIASNQNKVVGGVCVRADSTHPINFYKQIGYGKQIENEI